MLVACAREPIHVPGAIQPHGLLLIADATSLRMVGGAGDLSAELGADWAEQPLEALLGQTLAVGTAAAAWPSSGVMPLALVRGLTQTFEASAHRCGEHLLIELEPLEGEVLPAGSVLAWMDAAAAGFERASDLDMLCERAAAAFRTLTGFDRVMVYRFLDDESGQVIGEDRDSALGSFLHHHFPASDIPRQARALYVRNRVRVIPDVDYVPAPIEPTTLSGIDLSDVALRSVSPIHLEYLRNMGVRASASVSIVRDGVLWGLIACHHNTPRTLPPALRSAAAALAGGLARQIRAKEEAAAYRERLRLRAEEDSIVPSLGGDGPIARTLRASHDPLRQLLGGDGIAFVGGGELWREGICPPEAAVDAIARWAAATAGADGVPLATDQLPALCPAAAGLATEASGLLALPLGEGAMLLWFRVERVEEIEWAGNPHKTASAPGEALTPRASFRSWTEAVRGRSRRWSLEEVESARRLARALEDGRRSWQLRRLNRELERTLGEKETLIRQKDMLMKEVDHRVQNSLQLVASFLSVQARAAGEGALSQQLGEAQSRLQAVALVHRRLYRDDQIRSVDLGRYLDELTGDLKQTLGPDWGRHMRLDLAPMLVATDRAVSLGLVLTELVINATKYAYRGAPGPLEITLEAHGARLRLIVADRGRGADGSGEGFGSRILRALVDRLDGTLEQLDNQPGLRVVLTAPTGEGRG